MSSRSNYTILLRMGSTKLLALVMIVKDEARSLPATLDSVRGVVDRITIVDTGSTDGTQDIVRAALADGFEGELVEAPFVDFSTTRNLALEKAEDKADFLLMLSGDETLLDGASLREFCIKNKDDTEGGYHVSVKFVESIYSSCRLTRSSSRWRYRGVVHEVIVGPEGEAARVRVPGASIFHDRSHCTVESVRRAWERDLRILKEEHRKNPKDTRTAFYLAQTHECLGQHAKALEAYWTRVHLQGWSEEVYESMFRIARVMHALRRPWPEVQQAYLDAHEHSPHRAEPIYAIAKHYHDIDSHALCFLFAQRAASIPYPEDSILFIDHEVYSWKSHDLVAIHGFYLNPSCRSVGKVSAKIALDHRPDDPRLRKNFEFYKND